MGHGDKVLIYNYLCILRRNYFCAITEYLQEINTLKKFGVIFFLSISIFLTPLLWLRTTTEIRTHEQAERADAALIFGAIVRGKIISPLHKERLDTAVKLYTSGTVNTLVVSNSPAAARHMKTYLLEQGVSSGHIELDDAAERTPQTCEVELRRHTARSVILISQTFHLMRIGYQCRKLGLNGQLVTATPNTSSTASLWTKVRIRSHRYFREAALIWAAIFGLYPS